MNSTEMTMLERVACFRLTSFQSCQNEFVFLSLCVFHCCSLCSHTFLFPLFEFWSDAFNTPECSHFKGVFQFLNPWLQQATRIVNSHFDLIHVAF